MVRTALAALALSLSAVLVAWSAPAASGLPRFTEEREAAAVHFVKKHVPELLPVLDQLKKDSVAQYQREISEIFQVTEMLADLRDDMRRYELELKIWITENKAHVLVARLAAPTEEEKRVVGSQLLDLARQLVALDLDSLELKAEQLDRELNETRDELARIRDNRDKHSRQRYDALLLRGAKNKK